MSGGVIDDGTLLGKWKRTVKLPIALTCMAGVLVVFVVTEPAHRLLQKVLPEDLR